MRLPVVSWLLWICMLLAFGARAEPPVPAESFPSQPPAVHALRWNYDAGASELRDRAIALRDQASDEVARAWATLALIELENELEHEATVFALLGELERTSINLAVPDLRFAVLTLAAVVYSNRSRLDDAAAALDQMQALQARTPNPDWQMLTVHHQGVLERKRGHFDLALAARCNASAMKACGWRTN